ncbi:3771_t:CDS:2 [Ambispora leptoticha]|uniref:3771_t:CDS:1 n=1 Tax=Ambispora leptoticha TaxID=144679 RepID=A0A9N9FY72_9GLOM|nr:3771_t:CDS:2 [Ambispora leptoticha]
MNNFELEAFGTLSNSTGFSRKPHPYNLLYSAWKLHDGYDSSDKDKPLNINSSIIKDLYNALLDFTSISINYHFEHAGVMNCEPLSNILIDDQHILNLLVVCIYQNEQLVKLPPGRRAHEMPDKVHEWHKFLQDIAMNFETFFANELLEALDALPSEEFGIFFNDLEQGIVQALEHFNKWFLSWLHLPLVVCCLVAELENDLKNGITDDFGLRELLLQNENFLKNSSNSALMINHLYGLFDILDLKTHPNMSLSVKQSKLRLSSTKIDKENLSEGLKEIRENRKKILLQEVNVLEFGPNIASNLFNN